MNEILMILGLLLAGSLFISLIMDIPFGSSISLSYIIAALFMFASSVMESFSFWREVFIAGGVVLLALSVLALITKGTDIKKWVKTWFTPGIFIFSGLFIYMYYVTQRVGLTQIDDFLRWGGMVRDCMKIDHLYTLDQAVMIPAGRYPPFTTLVSVFFNKLAGNTYSESMSLMAIGTLCISLVMPSTDRLRWSFKDIVKSLLYTVLIVGILLSVQMNPTMIYQAFIFNSTYVDWPMALLTAYGLYQIFTYRGRFRDGVIIGMVTAALTITDSVSLAFAALVLGTFLLRALFYRPKTVQWGLGLVIAIVIPAVIYFGWKAYVHQFNPTVFAPTFVNRGALLANDNMIAAEWLDTAGVKGDIMNKFIDAIIHEPIMVHPLALNYIWVVSILTVGIFLLSFIYKKKGLRIISVLYLLGAAAYALAIMYGYMNLMSEYEAIRLAQYGRYLQTYTYIGYVLILLILLRNGNWIPIMCAALIVGLCMEPQSLDTVKIHSEKVEYQARKRAMIDTFVETKYQQGQRILALSMNDQVYRQFVKYVIGERPVWINYETVGDELTSEAFLAMLKDYDYLLIMDFNDQFTSVWQQSTNQALYGVFYAIFDTEGGVVLQEMYFDY